MATSVQVVFDCADPDRLAHFWARALGYKLQDPPPGYATWQIFLAAQGVPSEKWASVSAVVDPEGRGPRIYFQKVPEAKEVKNRVHLDVNVGGGHSIPLEERKRRIGEQAEQLVAVGATILRPNEQDGEYSLVMADPEGNEFCLH